MIQHCDWIWFGRTGACGFIFRELRRVALSAISARLLKDRLVVLQGADGRGFLEERLEGGKVVRAVDNPDNGSRTTLEAGLKDFNDTLLDALLNSLRSTLVT